MPPKAAAPKTIGRLRQSGVNGVDGIGGRSDGGVQAGRTPAGGGGGGGGGGAASVAMTGGGRGGGVHAGERCGKQ
jgi:hypothetical protein